MEINKVLSELDNLFDTGQIDKVEEFLKRNYGAAISENDLISALSLLNELIGYYREMTMKEEAKNTAQLILETIEKAGLKGTIAEGTSLTNIATAYRFLGDYEQSKKYYDEVIGIYEKQLQADDMLFASVYNNESILYDAMGDYKSATSLLLKAIDVVQKHDDQEQKLAISYTNLGQEYIKLEDYERALLYLLESEEIFERLQAGGIPDSHYCGCANALGALYSTLGRTKDAVYSYEKALLNIYDTAGMTDNYRTIYNNYLQVCEKAGLPRYSSMLELCEAYYNAYGAAMIEEKFPEYKDKIAVGLCGEGSECFGFEDEISLDHDCGPGFAMFVTNEVYAAIGERLQEEYRRLPRIFAGRVRHEMSYASGRVGVCTIDGFFERVLGGNKFPSNDEEWKNIPEYALACATNGKIFVDKLGTMTAKREYLCGYYPKNVWREKLARSLISCAQTGQYNYGRMMARGEYVTAQIILSDYMKEMMQCVFLINKVYAPYYKWLHKAAKNLQRLPQIPYLLEAICDMPMQKQAWEGVSYNTSPNEKDMVAMTIEIIAGMVVEELKKMGLITQSINDVYLETHGKVIMSMDNTNSRNLTRQEMIELIVKLEWNDFDKTKNEGGRASCQNDWNTFSIMRKSQYMTWPDELLSEYIWHFEQCINSGRNLITEKYGRMMESTAPDKYEEIKASFPELSDERKAIQEAIISIQVGWMEEFAQKYPKMAGNARSIHTKEDNEYNTSYETYLRGELGTYSEEMISLYGQFIASLAREGKNLAYETMSNTARLYGYESVEQAEHLL